MNRSIKFKMLLTFSSLLLLSCVLISFFLTRSSMTLVKESVGKQATTIVENTVKVIDADRYEKLLNENDMADYYEELRKELNSIRESNGMDYLYTMKREKNGEKFDYFYIVDGMPLDSKDASVFEEKEENIDAFPAIKKAFETGNVEFELSKDNTYGEFISIFAPIKNNAGEMIGIVGADIDASEVYKAMRGNIIETIVITIIIFAIGLLVIYMFTAYLTNPLRTLTEKVKQIGQGDLSIIIETNRKDEIGELTKAFQQMVVELKQLIHGINSNSNQLIKTSEELLSSSHNATDASRQIVSSIKEVSEGSFTIYKSSDESSSTLAQLATDIQHIAIISGDVSQLSAQSLTNANAGTTVIENVIRQMEIIQHSVQLSEQAIQTLEEHADEISSITEMIHAIASQTNLLSLNASIEAARAGEHGKGFAIVADEVRKLAEQSEQSANRISSLISLMTEDTSRTAITMRTVTNNVHNGIILVQDAGEAFITIVESIQEVTDQIKKISRTSEEMSAFSEEIAVAVEDTTKIASLASNHSKNVVALTVEQESYMSEISTSMTTLTTMAKDLDEVVRKFVIK